jgi:hypothetical protein
LRKERKRHHSVTWEAQGNGMRICMRVRVHLLGEGNSSSYIIHSWSPSPPCLVVVTSPSAAAPPQHPFPPSTAAPPLLTRKGRTIAVVDDDDEFFTVDLTMALCVLGRARSCTTATPPSTTWSTPPLWSASASGTSPPRLSRPRRRHGHPLLSRQGLPGRYPSPHLCRRH